MSRSNPDHSTLPLISSPTVAAVELCCSLLFSQSSNGYNKHTHHTCLFYFLVDPTWGVNPPNKCYFKILVFHQTTLIPPTHVLHTVEEKRQKKHAKTQLLVNNSYINAQFQTETWNNSTDCCEWDGVTCDNVSNYVTGLDLCCNNLKVDVGIGDLVNLTHLNLSYCNLSGNIPSTISHLSKLVSLDLSRNWMELKLNPFTWKKLIHNATNLSELYLDRVDMSSIRESSLSMLKNLSSSLVSLSLSYSGLQENLSSDILSLPNLQKLDLSYNYLSGQLPKSNWSTPLRYMDLSSNAFSGDISSTFCNASVLGVLNLAHNKLTGMIPQYLGTLPSLSVLDLQMNSLYGSMPRNFSKENQLETIKLNGNQLEGPLPHSLALCKKLEVLDLGDNMIEDVFPNWLGILPELQVLRLRSNQLYGTIKCSSTKHSFLKLRIFDVSNNKFSGPLPTSCIKKFQGMMNVNDSQIGLQYIDMDKDGYYIDSVVVIMKGFSMELTRILTTFTTIDLSNNMFEGEIPQLIGDLKFLIGLNLSNNGITGNIPQSLSYLRNLEWLDLSKNQLRGEIPMALTNLNFLAVLNLSQNHLEGIIPKGQQFDTFRNDSYEGNAMLCGLPLSKSCINDEDQPPHSTSEDEEESGFGWKAVAIGYACGALSGLLLGHNVFFFGKPEWLARLVEQMFNMRLKRTNNRAGANRRRMN
ncbi:hypothetical protein TSUD_250530 [Trifolium subterraneum]|nr:hypothetical protein TSUD_250530 [Trifolium subterraneum]